MAKVFEEVAETLTGKTEVKPKKATKAGKEKAAVPKDDVEKPVKAKKGKNVEDKKEDATIVAETAPTRSKSKKTQPIPAPVEEPTVVEAEPKPKKKKGKKESAVEEKVIEIPEPTIVAPETILSKDASKKAKKTKDTKKSTVASTAPEVAPIPAPVDPTPSTISAVQPSKKTKRSKAKEPSPEPEPPTLSADEAVEADGELDSDDEDVHLHGFSTDDDDSSDEEDEMDFESSAFDVSKLPTIAKDDATVKRKLDKAKRQPVCLLFFKPNVSLFIAAICVDRRPGCPIPRTVAPRFLRRPDEGLLLSIWYRDSYSPLAEQKGPFPFIPPLIIIKTASTDS